MSPEDQRIAMAELDGWTHLRYAGMQPQPLLWGFRASAYVAPDAWYAGCPGDSPQVPYYLDDLNAVARVVTKLSAPQLRDYRDALAFAGARACIDATAARRTEAILKATGKWTDKP
jgi:hypothetical protein